MNLSFLIEVILSFFSGFLALAMYLFSPAKKSIPSHLIGAFLLLSLGSDLANFSLWLKEENNLHIINTYEYIAIALEMGFMHSVMKFKKGFVTFTGLLVTAYFLLHAAYNYRYGFLVISTFLGFVAPLLVCGYAAFVSFKILSSDLKKFQESKHLLIPIFGFFIFEASCLIPATAINIYLVPEFKDEKQILAELHNHAISVGSITRNVLFTIYFIMARRNFNEHQNFI